MQRVDAALGRLGRQWPGLPYLGLGAYHAWIWLCYCSPLLAEGEAGPEQGSTVLSVYLVSTLTLSAALLLSALFSRRAERLVCKRAFVLGAGLVACAGTLVIAGAAQAGNDVLLCVGGVATGSSTAFVVLRLGCVYGKAEPARSASCAMASLVLACMLYFVALGLPRPMGLAFMSLLPLAAAACTLVGGLPGSAAQDTKPLERHGVSGRFLARLFFGIALLSFAVSVLRGFALAVMPAQSHAAESIFAASAAVLAVLVGMGLLGKGLNIPRLYRAAIVASGAGISLMPLLGFVASSDASLVGGEVLTSVAFEVLILLVWCVYAQVAFTPGASAVRVFGLGRAGSALGSTVGQAFGAGVCMQMGSGITTVVAISVIALFVVFATSTLLLNEGLICEAADVSRQGAGPASTLLGAVRPDGDKDDLTEGEAAVQELALRYGLSAREQDVLVLLVKGRTIAHAASKLNISFNTAKTHVRGIYQKTGVNTRQELLDLIECQPLEG